MQARYAILDEYKDNIFRLVEQSDKYAYLFQVCLATIISQPALRVGLQHVGQDSSLLLHPVYVITQDAHA